MVRRIGGVDYSLTCPSVCIYTGNEKNFNFETCKIFFLANQKKYENFQYENIEGSQQIQNWKTAEERYDFISDWALDIFIYHKIEEILLEDYSYGSKGKIFHIAENTGILKWKLWDAGFKYHMIASRNLQEELVIKSEKIGNPTSDIVDSYFICKLLLDM